MCFKRRQKAQSLLEYALLTAISIVGLLAVLRWATFNDNQSSTFTAFKAFKNHFDRASYYIGGIGVTF
ncbi:MAG: hypothetical protein V2A64_06190 [Candidatus Omnitrophota bacterium]